MTTANSMEALLLTASCPLSALFTDNLVGVARVGLAPLSSNNDLVSQS